MMEVSMPESSGLVPSGAVGDAYTTRIIFDGGSSADVTNGVVELYSYDGTNGIWKGKRPTKDSLPWPQVGLLPGAQVTQSSSRFVNVASWFYDNRPMVACMSATPADALAIGQECGTVKDSFALKVGNKGFVIVGVLADSGGRRFALVRPFSGGNKYEVCPSVRLVENSDSAYTLQTQTGNNIRIYGGVFPLNSLATFRVFLQSISGDWGPASSAQIGLTLTLFSDPIDVSSVTWATRPTSALRSINLFLSDVSTSYNGVISQVGFGFNPYGQYTYGTVDLTDAKSFAISVKQPSDFIIYTRKAFIGTTIYQKSGLETD